MRALLFAALLAGCASDSGAKRPDGGWCYWARDIIKTEAQCECVYNCLGCCSKSGECRPLDAGTCPAGSVAGIFRI